ncbi:MAG: putative sugar nucleotidyl transferase [Pirellulales bacterium]
MAAFTATRRDGLMNILCFEDRLVSRLAPITIGRGAFNITIGSFRLFDRLLHLGLPVRFVVRPHLRQVMLQSDLPPAPFDPAQPTLAVNARLLPSASVMRRLAEFIEQPPGSIVADDSAIAAAWLPPEYNRAAAALEYGGLEDLLRDLALPRAAVELPLLDYPHDVVRYHLKSLGENLEERIAGGGYQQTRDGLFVGPNVTLGECLTLDTSGGPVVLDDHVTVGPHAFLSGPAYVGPYAKIAEYSSVKHGTSVGHRAKIGGEVEDSVIEPLSNKQHHGFLGHSYLGSWVNLGAGTSVSDLKNTYGNINMQYGDRRVATDMQFLGCIIGDYAKAAVNTSIFTGKTIGVCSMLYGFVTTNVPSFVNYARSFGQVSEVPVEVMIATQARMYARRDIALRACDIDLLRDMHELTAAERVDSGEPLSSEPLSL